MDHDSSKQATQDQQDSVASTAASDTFAHVDSGEKLHATRNHTDQISFKNKTSTKIRNLTKSMKASVTDTLTQVRALPTAYCGGAAANPKPKGMAKGQRIRLILVSLPLFLMFGGLGYRLVQIQFVEGESWDKKANRQRFSKEKLQAPRGEIRGAGNEVLVKSTPSETVFVDLKIIKEKERAVQQLAPLLDIPEEKIREKVNRTRGRIVYIKRNVNPKVTQYIRKLKIRGIGFEKGNKRHYLWGKHACHVIGFAGMDGGKDGIELKLDTLLKGIPGYRYTERDARRRALSRVDQNDKNEEVPQEKAPQEGLTVQLTIVPGLQHVAEEELAKVMEKFNPKGASALVMDVTTGAIVALANVPNYDSNNPGDSTLTQRRNRALSDSYEPGSTFKAFTCAMALEKNICRPKERFDCQNGAWRLGYRTLHDSHAYGMLTFEEVLIKSSNIGSAKIGMRLGLDGMYETVKAFGFGEKTNIDLPGEAKGIVRPRRVWSKDSLLSIPMGQEIAVTPLQLVTAYTSMLNGGVLLRPQIVYQIKTNENQITYRMKPQAVRRVISAETSATMRDIMHRIVVEGTGRKAWCKEYAIGGKTGTAQKVVDGRYSHKKYVASFCGFAPVNHPRLVCLVAVDEPDKRLGYYGGTVAAPAVKEILRRGLRALRVPMRTPVEQKQAQEWFRKRKRG